MTPENQNLVEAMIQAWFQLAPQEDYPRTPDITSKLDKLTAAIRKMKSDEK